MSQKTVFPILVLIRSICNALVIQTFNHSIKFSLPHLFEPICFSEPSDNRRTDRIISTDEQSPVPRSAKLIVAITAKSPYQIEIGRVSCRERV